MGYPKTGTTSLQSLLYHNKAELARQGIAYPIRNIAETRFMYGHNICTRLSPTRLGYDWERYRADFLNEMLEMNLPTNVLSSEFLLYEHTDDIQFWSGHFDVFPVYYISNYYDNLYRLHKELIKGWFPNSLDKLIANRHFRILGTMKHLLKAWPREKFTFRDYDSLRNAKLDIRDDFLKLINADKSALKPTPNENISLPDSTIAFIHQLGKTPLLSEKEFVNLRSHLKKISLPEYTFCKFNALPKIVFSPSNYVKAAVRYQGILLDNPAWFDWTMERGHALSKIRYQDLEPEAQYEIFIRLPDKSQATIRKYLPRAGKNRHEPFLPALAGAN